MRSYPVMLPRTSKMEKVGATKSPATPLTATGYGTWAREELNLRPHAYQSNTFGHTFVDPIGQYGGYDRTPNGPIGLNSPICPVQSRHSYPVGKQWRTPNRTPRTLHTSRLSTSPLGGRKPDVISPLGGAAV